MAGASRTSPTPTPPPRSPRRGGGPPGGDTIGSVREMEGLREILTPPEAAGWAETTKGRPFRVSLCLWVVLLSP